MKKSYLLLLPLLTITSACANNGVKTKVVVKSNEILYIRCDARMGEYTPTTITNGNTFNYVENRVLSFTYTTNEIVVYATFDYGYHEKTHVSIVDTFHGNVSWAIIEKHNT